MRKIKVAFQTLGCKSNLYDTIIIEEQLKQLPIEIVPFTEVADIYIVNSCSVTNRADYESRNYIRKTKKTAPNSELIVTGCYAHISKNKVEQIDEVDTIFLNTEKDLIANYIKDRYFPDQKELTTVDYIDSFDSRTRPFIKVQDGCNSFCSYCIIPYGRTKFLSMKPEELIKQIEILSNKGYKEVVLTGIHLGYYGKDLDDDINFLDLLKIVDKKSSIDRLRVSSIDPDEITDQFIQFLSKSKIVQNHLHIALQSGSDKVLKDMNRRYNVDTIVKNIEKCKKEIKNFNFGFDIITGFPTETEENFNETYQLIEKLSPGYLHVFPYSSREGTKASKMKQLNGKIVKGRAKKLRELGEKLKLQFLSKYIGKKVEVLIEEEIFIDGETYFRGYTSNYIDTVIKKDQSGEIKTNLIIELLVESIDKKRGILVTRI